MLHYCLGLGSLGAVMWSSGAGRIFWSQIRDFGGRDRRSENCVPWSQIYLFFNSSLKTAKLGRIGFSPAYINSHFLSLAML